MDKFAVVKARAENTGMNVSVQVVTPWTFNPALAEASLQAHREIDPGSIYGILRLPEKARARRRAGR